MSLGSLNIRIGGSIEGLQKALNNAERKLNRSARKFDRIGTSLSQAISLPLLAAGGAGLKFAFDLDTSFSKIENLVGITGPALDSLKEGVKSLSGPLGAMQGDLSEALFTITSAGARGSEAMRTLEQASKASSIGLGDTTEIARAATAIVNNYGEANINAAKAIDQVTAAARVGNFQTEEFAPAIGKVLPLANALGISFAEVSANVATFTKGGLSAKESITGLKSLLSNLVKPGQQTKEALAQLGITTEGLQKSIKQKGLASTLIELVNQFDGNTEALSKVIPNVEGLVNALSVAGSQGEDYVDNLRQIENAVGIVDKGFDNVSKGGAFKMKQALANLQTVSIELGNILVPFATAIISKFNSFVSVFSGLDRATKELAVGFGVLLASIGPVYKAKAAFANLQLTLINLGKDLLSNLKSLSAGLINMAANFQKLNLAMKATTIGLVVAGIAAAIAVFQHYNNQLSATEKAQMSLNNIGLQARKNTAAQRVQTTLLINTLKDENASRKEKARALKELNKISPQYFGGLDAEKSKIEEINKALEDYIVAIEKRAKLQAANERLVEIEKELLETHNELTNSVKNPSLFDNVVNSALSLGNANAFVAIQTARASKEFAGSTKALEAEKQALLEFIGVAEKAAGIDPSGSPQKPPPLQELSGPQIDDSALGIIPGLGKRLKAFSELETITQSLTARNSDLAGSLKTVADGQVNAADAFGMANVQMIDQFQRMTDLTTAGTVFSEGLSSIIENGLTGFTTGLGEMAGALAAGSASIADVGKFALGALADMLINVGKLAIQTGVAIKGIKIALKSLNPAVAIAGGLALVALGNFVKGKLSSSVPALAEGGLAFGPTLAVVGDNPGARGNPEVIAPLDKLKRMMHGGGGTNITVGGRINFSGSDMSIALERADYEKSRVRGR